MFVARLLKVEHGALVAGGPFGRGERGMGAAGNVPNVRQRVVAACQELIAIGCKGQRAQGHRLIARHDIGAGRHRLAGRCIVEPDLISGAQADPLPVAMQRERANAIGDAGDDDLVLEFTAGQLPDARAAVTAGRDQAAPIAADKRGRNFARMSSDGQQRLAGRQVPHARRAVNRSRGQVAPILAKEEAVDGIGVAGQGIQPLPLTETLAQNRFGLRRLCDLRERLEAQQQGGLRVAVAQLVFRHSRHLARLGQGQLRRALCGAAACGRFLHLRSGGTLLR